MEEAQIKVKKTNGNKKGLIVCPLFREIFGCQWRPIEPHCAQV